MFSEKIITREQIELDKALKNIEKIQSYSFREFFEASSLSKEDFVEGILEFTESDQQGMVYAMLKDEVLNLVLGERLKEWHKTTTESRQINLEMVYDILNVESKRVYPASHIRYDSIGPRRLKPAVVNLIEEKKSPLNKRFGHYRAAVVLGDHRGRIGIGFGESRRDRLHCMNKAINIARKHVVCVPLVHGTLTHEVSARHEETEIYLRPADPGTGIISEDCLTIVCHQVGISDLWTEIKGEHSRINILKATMTGFLDLIESKKKKAHIEMK